MTILAQKPLFSRYFHSNGTPRALLNNLHTQLILVTPYFHPITLLIWFSTPRLIPSATFQTLLLMIGMILSGSVLVLTFWPTVRDDDKKVAIAVSAAIILFHGLLALGFLLYFFKYPSLPEIVPSSIAPAITSTIPAITMTTSHGKS